MGVKFADNAVSTLAADIDSTDLALTVASGEGALFPELGGSDYFYATLISGTGTREIVKVTARTDDAFTIERAQGGTAAAAFLSGSRIELRVTAIGLTAMYDELVAMLP